METESMRIDLMTNNIFGNQYKNSHIISKEQSVLSLVELAVLALFIVEWENLGYQGPYPFSQPQLFLFSCSLFDCTRMKLPDNFAKEYFKNGVAVVPDFITPEECDSLKKDMHDLVDELDFTEHLRAFDFEHKHADDYFLKSSDGVGFFLEKSALKEGKLAVDRHLAINKIGHALHVYRQPFRRITFHKHCKELLKALHFKHPVCTTTMYIFKQPRIGDAVDIHQDTSFINVDPPEKLVGIWIALDDATIENGCLWYIKGSHNDGLRGNVRLVRKIDPKTGKPTDELEKTGDWPTRIYDGEEWIPLEVKRGTAVIIHGTVIHKSEPNKSDKPRNIYSLHILDEAEGIWDKQNWLQPHRGPFWPIYETDPEGTDKPAG